MLSATRANKFLRGKKMKDIIIKGKIEFCEDTQKEYNREFKAILQDSPAFQYGNKTAVFIFWGKMANGRKPDYTLIDTRYDKTIKRNETDFKKWLQKYLKDNYQEHILTIY